MTEKQNENEYLDDFDFSVFENEDWAEKDIDLDELEEKLESKLRSSFEDVEQLKKDLESVGNPDKLGKVILDEVWHQFGNQIGLDMTNETLIQKYERENPQEYSDIKDSIMQDPAYKAAKQQAQEAQMQGGLVDKYTGKELKPGDKVNIDHVVPRKQIFDDPRRKQAGIETGELANKSENLAATNEALNKSKGAKSNSQYVSEREQREKDLIAQNERANKKIDESNLSETEKRLQKEKNNKALQDKLDADDDLMLEAEKKAQKAIKKDINKGVAKNVAKKAGVDALKSMAVSAIFTLLKEIMNALVRFFKSKSKTFKSFLDEMKKAIKGFFEKILDVLQVGASALIGTILSEIFGPIVSMFILLNNLSRLQKNCVTKMII